jgi:hypothetical protein
MFYTKKSLIAVFDLTIYGFYELNLRSYIPVPNPIAMQSVSQAVSKPVSSSRWRHQRLKLRICSLQQSQQK